MDQQENKQEQFEKWSKDPANWKLGMFYYNKDDKRILPPKQNKWMGWTINFANPVSIFLFALFLLAIVFILNLLSK
jgi:uncharacterized membrane protein